MNTIIAGLRIQERILRKKGTQTALTKITKYVAPSISKVGSVAKGVGFAGVGLNAAVLGYNYFVNGQGITASNAFDLAVGVGFAALTIANPAVLIGVGVYGILDAAGTFDGIKESLGGNTIIIP